MDEFAQSREDNDLFSDDFEPAATPTVVEDPTPNPTKPPQLQSSTAIYPETFHNNNGHGRGRGGRGREGDRGRGAHRADVRGGRGAHNGRSTGGLANSRWADNAPHARSTNPKETTAKPTGITAVSAQQPAPSASAPADPTVPSTSEAAPPTDAQPAPVTPRTTAVRGDRSATGGPAVKKLTEEELSAKMAQMAIINAAKAERFRLSEADSAAFQLKEKELARKRVEEQKNARAMDMERAKNRERKLKAQGGREWDSEKLESDLVDRTKGRSSEFVRGGHGGVIRGGLEGRGFSVKDAQDKNGGGDFEPVRYRESFEARGRGGRGRGRGGDRGGRIVVPTSEDFPELPGTKKADVSSHVKSPAGETGDWAEEMATPSEDVKKTLG